MILLKMCNGCFSILENDIQICPKCKSTSFNYLFENDNSINIQAKKQCKQQYQPHCPICGSPNVEKISTASKVGKAALFGVFSLGSIGKTYKCKSCGAKF